MERVGVLVVHGIGDQRRGASVRQAADALARALRGARTVTMPYVDVDPEGDRTRPAHVEMVVSAPGDPAERWLLAESWWARSFDPPTFREVLRWAWRVAPGLLAVEAWRRRDDEGDLTPGGALLLALTPVTVTLLALLVLLSVIPLRRVRDLVGRIQVTLTGTLGDSAVLDDGVVGSAITSRVRTDLGWLAEQPGVTRVVVLAHSQGAAIAHRVLGTDAAAALPDVPLDLVTFGSGLDKLTTARLLHQAPAGTRASVLAGGLLGGFSTIAVAVGLALAPWWLAAGLFGLGCAAGALVVFLGPAARRRGAGTPFVVTVAALLIVGFVLLGYRALSQSPPAASAALAGSSALVGGATRLLRRATVALVAEGAPDPRTLTWLDVRSALDPVPDPRRATTTVITNTGSVLRDHTTYWANAEEFVPLVLATLGVATEPRPRRMTRRTLLRALHAVRVAVAGAGAVAVYALWDRLPGIADGIVSPVLRALSRMPLVDIPDAIRGEDRWALRLAGALLVLVPAAVAARAVRAQGDTALARRAPDVVDRPEPARHASG